LARRPRDRRRTRRNELDLKIRGYTFRVLLIGALPALAILFVAAFVLALIVEIVVGLMR
jgi:hypothetical protein